MIKLTYCLHRLPHLSRAEFQRYWRETHAPLVAAAQQALGIRRYVQCHTMASAVGDATAGDVACGMARARITTASPNCGSTARKPSPG